MYQIERARPNTIQPKYASYFADRKSYCTNMPRYIQKKPTASFSDEKITASEKEWKTRNTFPPQECLQHFHHASDDFTLFDSPGDPPLTSPYIVEEKTSSFMRRVARGREKEKEENPFLSSRSFRLPTSRTKMTPVATLNTRRLLRNHLLTAFPCRKEITDTAISCEGSETRAEKLFQRSSIRLPKRGYLHESLLNLPIYRFFSVFPASFLVLSIVHSALSLPLSVYLSISVLVGLVERRLLSLFNVGQSDAAVSLRPF